MIRTPSPATCSRPASPARNTPASTSQRSRDAHEGGATVQACTRTRGTPPPGRRSNPSGPRAAARQAGEQSPAGSVPRSPRGKVPSSSIVERPGELAAGLEPRRIAMAGVSSRVAMARRYWQATLPGGQREAGTTGGRTGQGPRRQERRRQRNCQPSDQRLSVEAWTPLDVHGISLMKGICFRGSVLLKGAGSWGGGVGRGLGGGRGFWVFSGGWSGERQASRSVFLMKGE